VTSFTDLQEWASGQIIADFDSVKRQITEYGSVDLEMMGVGLLEASKLRPGEANEHIVGMEMALIFYLQGKVSRCVSAIGAGRRPADDTLKDIRVYAFMLAHVRQFGHWKIEGADDGSGIRAESPQRSLDFGTKANETGGSGRDDLPTFTEQYPPGAGE
jgi:hypothetical protein